MGSLVQVGERGIIEEIIPRKRKCLGDDKNLGTLVQVSESSIIEIYS